MSFSRKCWQYIDDYLRNSSLHGLSYVGDSTLSFAERFCWLLCFIGAASFAGYWVSLIYIRQVPVTITENPTPVFVSDIPFPTVTVCNVNRVKRSAAHRMLNETNHSITKDMLKDFCRSNFVSITAANATTGSFPSVDINHFFSQIGHSCSDMVMRCFWKSEEIDCKKWMNPTITQEGLCCTFNLMPSSYILRYRSNSDRLKYTYPIIVEEWDQERGFSRNPILESIPWRSEGAGVFFGLSLILNANLSEYYCGFRKSSGFKVILNNPLELVGYSRQIPLQRETWMEIEAFVKETDKDTRSIPFGNRLCYFNSERYLRFFRMYSRRNCITECRSNRTLLKCDCTPYFLPKNSKPRICEPSDMDCVSKTREDGTNQEMCDCLSGCFEISYGAVCHYGLLRKDTAENISGDVPIDYFIENGAVLHLYYPSIMLKKYIRKEIYGFSEFLSNTGGFLGLFLGCSILSLVELVYYLSLKLICSMIRTRNEDTIYPFVN